MAEDDYGAFPVFLVCTTQCCDAKRRGGIQLYQYVFFVVAVGSFVRLIEGDSKRVLIILSY